MDRDDGFLSAYRKDPPPAAVEALWQQLSRQKARRSWAMALFSPKMVAACLAMALLVIVVVSPMRVMAQDLLRLFAQTAQETFSIDFTFDDPTDPQLGFEGIAPPADVDVDITTGADLHDVQPDYRYASLAAAQAQTDVPLQAPTRLPEGYDFIEGIVRTGSPLVTLVYGKQDAPLLTLHQTRATSDAPTAHVATTIQVEEPLSDTFGVNLQAKVAFGPVGPAAVVEPVQIGDAWGEQVRGTWRIDPDALTEHAVAPGDTVSIVPVWDAAAAGHMVRWQTDTTRFELITTDASLGIADVIDIATSVK